MAELTGAQKKYLRGLAHHLEAVVKVGKSGVTGPVLEEIDKALADHELIKVRLVAPQGRKRELAAEVAGRSGSALIGLVGNVVTLYLRQPDPEKRKIEIPG